MSESQTTSQLVHGWIVTCPRCGGRHEADTIDVARQKAADCLAAHSSESGQKMPPAHRLDKATLEFWATQLRAYPPPSHLDLCHLAGQIEAAARDLP